jgi:hypothetical protein
MPDLDDAARARYVLHEFGLMTYEDTVAWAEAHPEEVEQNWRQHDLKNDPKVQAELRKMIKEKIRQIRLSRSKGSA